MTTLRWTTLIATLCPLLAAAQTPPAKSTEEMEKYFRAAIGLYERLEYNKALSQLQKAKDKAKTPDDEARCLVMEGILLTDMGKGSQATKSFTEAFSIDPELKLPVVTAPKITALAEKVRDQVKKLLGPTLAAKKAEDERRLAEEKRLAEEARAREDDELKRARAAQAAKDEEERRKLPDPPPPPQIGEGPSVRSYAWIPALTGLAAAVGCAFAYGFAYDRFVKLGASPPIFTPPEAEEATKLGITLNQVGIGLGIGALVAGAGALVMYVVGKPVDKPQATLGFGPTGFSVSF